MPERTGSDDEEGHVVVVDAVSDDDFAVALVLFDEYAASLGIDLSFQHFESEREHLRDIYGPPDGALVLRYLGEHLTGCAALRRHDADTCEMKRLYVRPAARGRQAGRALAIALLERARAARYRRMVLDTLTTMIPAQALYRSLGFREVPTYYGNPLPDAVYFALDL